MTVQNPDVTVQLGDTDGNAFAIIARVRRALVDAGKKDVAAEYVHEATECGSYDELLRFTMKTVNVT